MGKLIAIAAAAVAMAACAGPRTPATDSCCADRPIASRTGDASCKGGCCDVKKDSPAPAPTASFLVLGDSSAALEKALASVPGIEKAVVKDDVAMVTVGHAGVVFLNELQKAVRAAGGEIPEEVLILSGRVLLKTTAAGLPAAEGALKHVSAVDGVAVIEVEDAKSGLLRAELATVSFVVLARAVREAGFSLEDVGWCLCPCAAGTSAKADGCCGSCRAEWARRGEARLRVAGLNEANLAAFAERVKSIRARRASDAKEEEPVVRDVRLQDGQAVLSLHPRAELRAGALEKALEGTQFKADRMSIAFRSSFNIVVSGMG